jgi:hypothetical protein
MIGLFRDPGGLHHAAKTQIVQAYDELQGLCFLSEDVRQSVVHELCIADIVFFFSKPAYAPCIDQYSMSFEPLAPS